MNAVTTKPVTMPASAPQALVRFPQIASSSTGKEPAALKVSDHRNSCSGSAGAAMASQVVTKAAPSRATRAVPMRAASGAVSLGRPWTTSSARMAAIATRDDGERGQRGGQRAGQRQIDEHLRKACGNGQRKQRRVALEADAGEPHQLRLGLDRGDARLLQQLEPGGQAIAGLADDLLEISARR